MRKVFQLSFLVCEKKFALNFMVAVNEFVVKSSISNSEDPKIMDIGCSLGKDVCASWKDFCFEVFVDSFI